MPTACSKRETKRFESKKGKSELSPADDQQARHFDLVTTREFDGGRALTVLLLARLALAIKHRCQDAGEMRLYFNLGLDT